MQDHICSACAQTTSIATGAQAFGMLSPQGQLCLSTCYLCESVIIIQHGGVA